MLKSLITPLLPLHGCAAVHRSMELRLLEEQASGCLPLHSPGALMEQAGLSAARLCRAVAPHAKRVAVLCGPGNNGGDGWITARHLQQSGIQVAGHCIGGMGRTADHRAAFAQAQAAGVTIQTQLEPAANADLVVDALLGLGLRDAPRGDAAAAIRALADHPAPRLALDIPSGLDADSGQDWGAAPCQHTLTFLAAKPGLFTGAGRQLCGHIWLASLGTTPTQPPCAQLLGSATLDEWLRQAPRARWRHASHKGRQGDLVVVAGTMTGAAVLAARAGLLAGAGRVYWVGPDRADPLRPELIALPTKDLACAEGKTVVAGCGWGPGRLPALATLLQSAARLVLDADGLNAVATDPRLQDLLCRRADAGLATVITPHPLEAARLLGCELGAVQSLRLMQAQALADRFRCTTLLKGSGTVVASPGRLPTINTTGHAALASAGTGDVLAGWLGGLWAQVPTIDPHWLAGLAAVWHGLAADAMGNSSAPLPAAELLQAMYDLHPVS